MQLWNPALLFCRPARLLSSFAASTSSTLYNTHAHTHPLSDLSRRNELVRFGSVRSFSRSIQSSPVQPHQPHSANMTSFFFFFCVYLSHLRRQRNNQPTERGKGWDGDGDGDGSLSKLTGQHFNIVCACVVVMAVATRLNVSNRCLCKAGITSTIAARHSSESEAPRFRWHEIRKWQRADGRTS